MIYVSPDGAHSDHGPRNLVNKNNILCKNGRQMKPKKPSEQTPDS